MDSEYKAFVRKGGKTLAYQQLINGRYQLVKTESVPQEVREYYESTLLHPSGLTTSGLTTSGLTTSGITTEIPTVTRADETTAVSEPVAPPEGTGFPPDLGIVSEPNKELDMARQALEEMQGKTIFDASIHDLAEALYERFGVYTVYLNRYPADDEISPFTAEPMTRYDKGVAYQAAIRAHASGVLLRDPEAPKRALDEGRKAVEEMHTQFQPAPQSFAENRQSNSFDYRTSVEGERDRETIPDTITHYVDNDGVTRMRQVESDNGARSVVVKDDFVDEAILEPQMGRKVIRPNW